MSFVDYPEQPQRSFPDRFQQYWNHPHPYGLIAMLRSAIDGVKDAVDGSVAATGAPPSTEEEAFKYNQARDRGPIGAFHAAEDFGPAAPRAIGGLIARQGLNRPVTVGLEGRVPGTANRVPNVNEGLSHRELTDGNLPETYGGQYAGGDLTELPRQAMQQRSLRQPEAGRGQMPRVAPENGPIGLGIPQGGLLGRVLDLQAGRKQSSGQDNGQVSSEPQDTNFRQLTRVPITTGMNERSAASAVEPMLLPSMVSPGLPDWWGQASKANKSQKRSSNKSRARRKDADDEDDDFCGKRYVEEKGICWQRKKDGDYAHPDFLDGCLERAKERWLACLRNGGPPGPGQWEPKKWGIEDEEVWINPDR